MESGVAYQIIRWFFLENKLVLKLIDFIEIRTGTELAPQLFCGFRIV